MSARSHPSFSHTGMVVPDLEEAIARYSDILGVRFAEPGRLKYPKEKDVGVDAVFRLDADGEPYAVFTTPCLMGARIEYVDANACRESPTEWARTGKPPI